MAKTKKKRKVNAGAHHHSKKRRKSNPFGRKGHHRRRRNPGMLTGAGSILKSGFYALVGLVIARQVPQWALGTRNSSWLGYGANLATTFVAAWITHKVLGPDPARMVAVGGGLYTVNRIIQDQLSPVGQVLSISGLGDYNALGDIQPGYFPLPVPTDANGNPIIPAELKPAPVMVTKPAGSGMAGISRSSRYANRF